MKKNRIYPSVALSIVLFLGGVSLLIFNPPFFGIYIGFPATLVGVGFIVLTFDKLNQLTLDDEE